MKQIKRQLTITIFTLLALPLISLAPASAQSAANWDIYAGSTGNASVMGSLIGVTPYGSDGYGGGDALNIKPSDRGVLLLCYREHGPGWDGPTGFYPGDQDKTPLSAGESRTWSDFYLWAQNITPTAANRVAIFAPNDPYFPPPAGYMGHLVLDYVPGSCNYTGPMDFWMDLNATTELALPIPVVTDPLQGTRFHMTVIAPVPEPSSLAALGIGIAPLGMMAIRRRGELCR